MYLYKQKNFSELSKLGKMANFELRTGKILH